MESLAERQKEAESWLQASNSDFKLLSVDENHNQLLFGYADSDPLSSFSITCPGPGEYWGVWSEAESMLQKLQDVIMHLDSKANLIIADVLQQVATALSQRADGSSQGAASTVSSLSSAQKEEESDDEDGANEEEEDDFLYYYGEEDPDVSRDVEGAKAKEEEKKMMSTFYSASDGRAKPSTIQRLLSDMKAVSNNGDKYGFLACPDGDNLFKWAVKLVNIPEDTQLGKDLQMYAQQTKKEAAIQMEMQFPWNYPFSPPFIRILRPRFKFRTGHVTIGGSICMQMLTKSGWLPSNDIEGVLVQVRAEILSDPEASLDSQVWDTPYSEEDARVAFNRMVSRYGWV